MCDTSSTLCWEGVVIQTYQMGVYSFGCAFSISCRCPPKDVFTLGGNYQSG
jgi:hypothetical protein